MCCPAPGEACEVDCGQELAEVKGDCLCGVCRRGISPAGVWRGWCCVGAGGSGGVCVCPLYVSVRTYVYVCVCTSVHCVHVHVYPCTYVYSSACCVVAGNGYEWTEAVWSPHNAAAHNGRKEQVGMGNDPCKQTHSHISCNPCHASLLA